MLLELLYIMQECLVEEIKENELMLQTFLNIPNRGGFYSS